MVQVQAAMTRTAPPWSRVARMRGSGRAAAAVVMGGGGDDDGGAKVTCAPDTGKQVFIICYSFSLNNKYSETVTISECNSFHDEFFTVFGALRTDKM